MLTFQVSFSLGHQHSSTELRPQDCSVIYLDPLWELWRQFRLWPGPALMWTCPESLQLLKPDPSQLQDHLLPFQMFPRHRPLGSGQQRYNSMVCAATRFQLFFISHRTLRAQLLLRPHLCVYSSNESAPEVARAHQPIRQEEPKAAIGVPRWAGSWVWLECTNSSGGEQDKCHPDWGGVGDGRGT